MNPTTAHGNGPDTRGRRRRRLGRWVRGLPENIARKAGAERPRARSGSSAFCILGRRLQTDYIDLYWIHAWDRFTPIDETMRALDDLVRAGKVRYIGLSDTPAWKVTQADMLARFHGWSPVTAIQIEYSLAERTLEGATSFMHGGLTVNGVPSMKLPFAPAPDAERY